MEKYSTFGRGVKRILRAVAVMDVKIYQQDTRQAMMGNGMGGGDGGVVENAEAHRPIRRRMVAGRANQRKRRVHAAGHHGVYRPDGCPAAAVAAAQEPGEATVSPASRYPPPCRDNPLHPVQIGRRMDALQLLRVSRA